MSSVVVSVNNRNIWVRETRFGRWFLGTHTWYRYVLSQAIIDLKALLAERIPLQPRILDAGCGQGLAFALLEEHFLPSTIIGIDIDLEQVNKAKMLATQRTTPTSALHCHATGTPFPDGFFDLILCHQLLHHTDQQIEVLKEFYRLLTPGGILLLGESCRVFINSLLIRLLFRHPPMAPKDAQGYITLLRNAGFSFSADDIRTSSPWWSRRCFGLAQKIGIGLHNTEPTEILIVATKKT